MTELKKKIRRFDIRLSQDDKKKLEKRAKESGITESAYIRKLINNEPVRTREDFQLIKSLVSEMNAIGNNINQIAHKFNAGIFSEYDRKLLLSLMSTLVKNTEQIINGKEKKGRDNDI